MMTSTDLPLLVPDWPAPRSVCARATTRHGGVSSGVFSTLNLGHHVGDDPHAVAVNRQRVSDAIGRLPVWLEQVHGIDVVDAATCSPIDPPLRADGAFSRTPGVVCTVMTADCLPVLFCDKSGGVVAAAHAGWRGLLAGVLESTLGAMGVPAASVLAWLGPAIGPDAFEVGEEVRTAFVARDAVATNAFVRSDEGKWRADIYQLARLRLAHCGVTAVFGGTCCTVTEAEHFFSYRRDGQTGRMASMIWLES